MLLAALLLAAHCQPTPADDDDRDLRAECQAACDRWEAEGCEQAQPTAEGVPCVDVCLNIEREGTLSIHPACVAEVNVDGTAGASNRCAAIDEACAE
jgi:hypothetical protein